MTNYSKPNIEPLYLLAECENAERPKNLPQTQNNPRI